MAAVISDTLLRKYDKPGPRYTSYPTVPVWSAGFGDEDYRGALSEMRNGSAVPVSVYLHLPFCAKRCDYCGCNAVAGNGPLAVDLYLDRVESELELVRNQVGRPLDAAQVHWGGGTPNYLNSSQVARAIALIRDTFRIADGAEVSLEADPRLGNAEQAAMLREAGFNRISLGFQDPDASVQKAIGRNQSEARARRFFGACRDAGFESVNIDLVYGLPAQTRESFARSLEVVLELEPDRVACFSYAHVPWVRPNQQSIDESLLPSPREKFNLFLQAVSGFTAAGYEWIGMDHFAKADDELAAAYRDRRLHRNFMGYTTRPNSDLLAFGMSGISEISGCFAQNESDLDGYMESVAEGKLPIVRGHRLSDEDKIRRRVITHLMCNMELPYDFTDGNPSFVINGSFEEELERMQDFEADGLLVIGSDRLDVTETGRFFVRNICMEWDAYLENHLGRPLFSRTV